MQKISILNTVVGGLILFWRHLSPLLLHIAPLLLLILLLAVTGLVKSFFIFNLLSTVVGWEIAYFIFRRVLLEETKQHRLACFDINKMKVNLVLGYIKLGLFLLVSTVFCLVVASVFFTVPDLGFAEIPTEEKPIDKDEIKKFSHFLLMMMFIPYYFYSRFALILPASALGKECSFMQSWHATAPFHLPIFFIVGFLPWLLQIIFANTLISYEAITHRDILISYVWGIFTQGFLITCFALAYKPLQVQPPPLPAADNNSDNDNDSDSDNDNDESLDD